MTFSNLMIYLKADLSRLFIDNPQLSSFRFLLKLFNPRFFPVLFLRLARYCYLNRFLFFISPIFTWINVLIFGVEITPKCDIGPGLILPHAIGVIIGANKIGSNATIFQGVTIGATSLDIEFNPALRPVIGDNFIVGAGAKILGGISIGNNVTVGANSVVIESLPDSVVAVGLPAKIHKKLR